MIQSHSGRMASCDAMVFSGWYDEGMLMRKKPNFFLKDLWMVISFQNLRTLQDYCRFGHPLKCHMWSTQSSIVYIYLLCNMFVGYVPRTVYWTVTPEVTRVCAVHLFLHDVGISSPGWNFDHSTPERISSPEYDQKTRALWSFGQWLSVGRWYLPSAVGAKREIRV